MPGNPLASHPAIRLLLPFTMGIVIGERYGTLVAAILLATVGIFIYAVLHFVSKKSDKRRYSARSLWIIPIFIISTATGMATAIIHRPAELNLDQINGSAIEARVTDINRKDFSSTLVATLQCKGYPRVQITTRGCDYTLSEGEFIRFICDLQVIANQGNPDEMDYAAYMWRKGIRYQQHLDEKPYHYYKTNNFIDQLYGLRHRLEIQVMNLVDDPLTQQLVIAMLLGDSRVIDKDLRDEFSRAGIAHTLALSGLHVGIIVWIVWLLLFPFDYWHLKKLRLALTIAALAAFCALTGFSPSAVRAALMIAISFTTYILYRRYSPFNALIVTALLILIFQPYEIFNIGFQLSFITIAVLLLTLPRWNRPVENRVVRYIKTSLVTSVVAMLATMMLTAYYFNTISIISPITNLITLPLIPVVIILGVILIIMAILGVNVKLIQWMADASCHSLQWAGNTLGGDGSMHLNNVYISDLTLVFYLIAITLLAWWLFYRNKAVLTGAITALMAMIVSQAFTVLTTPTNGLVIFNNFKSTPILAFDHGIAVLWVPDYDDDPQLLCNDFLRQHRAFLSHYRINHITTVTTIDTIIGNMAVHPPFASMNGRRIAVVDDKNSTNTVVESNIKNDIVVVGRHFKGDTLQCPGIIIYTGATNARHNNVTIPQRTMQHRLATQGAYMELM